MNEFRVERVMRRPVSTISPKTSVRAAAAMMKERGLGFLPVCEDGRPVGLITDRDIAVRWAPLVAGDASVESIMTRDIVSCRASQSVREAANLMGDRQIRRLVVLDDSGAVCGVLSLGDIANDVSEELAGQTLGEVVELR
ncbi:MAG: CBS domain-containing protein [Roseovarius sp.]|nr:CBS domain-containing protein [Roseovarius sp.]